MACFYQESEEQISPILTACIYIGHTQFVGDQWKQEPFVTISNPLHMGLKSSVTQTYLKKSGKEQVLWRLLTRDPSDQS